MWLSDLFRTRKLDRFFSLAATQAAILLRSALLLQECLSGAPPQSFERIDRLRQEGRVVLDQLNTALRDAFVTPIDRQDIYNLGEALDDMLGYLNNAAREIALFKVPLTPQMREIAEVLVSSAQQIRDAVDQLQNDPAQSWRCAKAAQAAEGLVEDQYRQALTFLFDEPDFHVVLKQREIYRHLSNSADRALAIGRLIGKIVVKAT